MTTLIYDTLAAEARRLELPKSYSDDLHVHDHKCLVESDDPPTCFGWVLRECGTFLLDARMSTASRLGYRGHCMQSGKDPADRFYWFDGSKLHSVTAHAMFDLMAESDLSESDDISHGGY